MDFQHKRSGGDDYPIYSRLFVVCGKNATEDDIREAFDHFGTIEHIGVPRDNTGHPKGVAFVKYSKTTEAAWAFSAMHRALLPNSRRPLKVMVSGSRSDILSDDDDDEKYRRLYINTYKNEDEHSLEEHFKQFGKIENITVQRDRNTGESKGGAYVKYRTFYDAAKAFEECDRKYRPIFAKPKANKRHETTFENNINSLAHTASNMNSSLLSYMNVSPGGFTQVSYMCAPFVPARNMEDLFNIIPGMTDFNFFTDLVMDCGKGTATYSSPVCASYAVEKLHGFEYPPGAIIQVRGNNQRNSFTPNQPSLASVANKLKQQVAHANESASPDLAKLTEAIAEASKLIKTCTSGVIYDKVPSANDLNYCSVKLPEPKPLADIDSPSAKRCFLVCKPQPPPQSVLRDVFCRFGDLIDVYTLPNKTIGYARYATAKAAEEAMKTLHGAELCGVRIKVLEAEDEAPPKRPRYD